MRRGGVLQWQCLDAQMGLHAHRTGARCGEGSPPVPFRRLHALTFELRAGVCTQLELANHA